MKIVDTSKTTPAQLSSWEREQVYNGLDCCVTHEVLGVLEQQLDNRTDRIYRFAKSLQAPVLEMRLRGIRIDDARKSDVIDGYHDQLDRLERQLDRIVLEGIGLQSFNWRSNPDINHLLYNVLNIPEVKKRGKATVDRDALEKMEAYYVARPIIAHLKTMRDIGKKISVLQTSVDRDGRMRTFYNIAGTTTGRLSSSFTEFGTGGNLQNVEEGLRSCFISDKGMKFGYFDAEQGESRVVGAIEWNLFGDGVYLDTCESGDLHTSVARLVWPEWNWTGNLVVDKELAEQSYYRHYSRRFMCKKIGHGSNYGGKPYALATQAKVAINLIEEFQPLYFTAFPAHKEWHDWTRQELKRVGAIESLFGRYRQFWGRRDSEDTWKEALAYQGQTLADILDAGMLEVWRQQSCQLMMQIHDAILVQYPEEQEDEIVPLVQAQLRYPIILEKGREFVIPYGCKTGWNWGNFGKDNPDGLKEYIPGDKRKRTPPVSILDRVVC